MSPHIDTMHILFYKILETEELVKYQVKASVVEKTFFWGTRSEWRSGILVFQKNMPSPEDNEQLKQKIFFEPESTEPLFLTSTNFLIHCYVVLSKKEAVGIFPDFIEKASG